MGINNQPYLDFDANPADNNEVKKLIYNAYKMASDAQAPRNNQYLKDYKSYHCISPGYNSSDWAYVFVPKTPVAVNTKTALNLYGTIGREPWIPFEAEREEFRWNSGCLNRMLTYYLKTGNFYHHYRLSSKLKIAYGTSFREAIPYRETLPGKRVIIDNYGQQHVEEFKKPLLRFNIKTYAPWQVYADPFATGLESKNDCRYIIIVEMTTPRQIIENYMKNPQGYPDFNVEAFADMYKGGNIEKSDFLGKKILEDIGLPLPEHESDVGLYVRYQSPSRYIDTFNGEVILRDQPNPYTHGQINVSRDCQDIDIHNQNSFWGLGDIKALEPMQSHLNDVESLTLNASQITLQPVTYYKKNAVNPNLLVRVVGNRIPIDSQEDKPLDHYVQDAQTTNLSRDHYLLADKYSYYADQRIKVYDVQRGEGSDSSGTTAYEFSMREKAGQVQHGLEISDSEYFLQDFGKKILWNISQFALPLDYVEVLGPEDTGKMLYTHPDEIPGGWNFTFIGSQRAAHKQVIVRDLKETLPMLLQIQNPAIMRHILSMLDTPEHIIVDIMEEQQRLEQMAQQDRQQEEQLNFERQMQLASFEAKVKSNLEGQKHQQKIMGSGTAKQEAQGLSEKSPNTERSIAVAKEGK